MPAVDDAPQAPESSSPPRVTRTRRRKARPQMVVGIGASAGGLKALQRFFSALPADSGMTFVVILHLAPDRESLLPELLQSHTAMRVLPVTRQVTMQPNYVYLISPGQQLSVHQDKLVVAPFQEPRGRRTPIDYFFVSLAEEYGDGAAMILSGSGTDGTLGIKAIKEGGGLLMVQDPQEAEYDGMPRSAIATGLVDVVLPVQGLAHELLAYQQSKRTVQLPLEPAALPSTEQEAFQQILAHLYLRTGQDFSQYKRATVLRRLQRRLQVTHRPDLIEYLKLLRQHGHEVELLFQDLLIGVTSFFRDADAFHALEQQVVPHLFTGKGVGETVRVWSAGCATGEEAYSIALLLLEHAARRDHAPEVQVFATDLNEYALQLARQGVYPAATTADISEEHLKRFFLKEDLHYRLKAEVRERVLFAQHNLLRDPPFAKLDLISCRNLLIYLERDLQERVYEIFAYALRPGGYLFLGTAEAADGMGELFVPVDKHHRLYQRRVRTDKHFFLPNLPLTPPGLQRLVSGEPAPVPARRSEAALHRQLLEEYAPPSVLVDDHYTVLHLSETAGRYLVHPGGLLTSDLTQLIRPELQLELRTALYRAFEHGKTTLTRPVPVQFNGTPLRVSLTVQPRGMAEGRHVALVLFLELEEEARERGSASAEPPPGSEDQQRLAAELKHALGRLQIMREEHETAEAELKTSNEELQSINEEYKSTLEELETSKEELQSMNEELQTVNQELKGKMQEVSQANSDLQNLLTATEIATLFLDRNLAIKRYTPRMTELFKLMPGDQGRLISDLKPKMDYPDLEADAQRVLQELMPVEREVQSEAGRWFLVSLRPYRTLTDHIAGVVLTFIDLTTRKQAMEELQALNAQLAERTQQVRRLAAELTLAEQRERHRIALMLHDQVQQLLFAVQFRLQLLRSGQSTTAADELAESEHLVQEAIQLIRTYTVELSPPVLPGEGLGEAIQWLSKQVQELYRLQVEVAVAPALPPLRPELRILLLQLIRELLFNVSKHAQVAQAKLSVRQEQDQLVVAVRDKGVGFDPATVEQAPVDRLGLRSIRERLELFGGHLALHTQPGAGTEAMLVLPLAVVIAQAGKE